MLEQENLLIQRGDPPTAWIIADGVTRQPLGVARWRPWTGPSWLHWLGRPILDVFETDDEPLVFMVRRLWGLSSKWEVCDADGHRVAMLRREVIVDAFDQFCSIVERDSDGRAIGFHRGERELAVATWSDEGTRLAFAPQLEGYPLIKMALLAAVLVA